MVKKIIIVFLLLIILSITGCKLMGFFTKKDKTLLKELKGTIVFQSDRVKGRWPMQLFKINLNNLKIEKLSKYNYLDETSPKAIGNKVYFNLSLTGDQRKNKLYPSLPGIYTIDLNGKNRKKIFGNNRLDSIVNFAILSEKLFILGAGTEESYNTQLYISQPLKELMSIKKTDIYVRSIFPDGDVLLEINSDKTLEGVLYKFNPKTKEKKEVLKRKWQPKYPSVSPDGKKIAFISHMDRSEELYIANVDGSNLKRLTNDKYPEEAPAFSPDGKYIVYASVRDGYDPFRNHTLHVITVDGKRTVQITEWDNSTDTNPTWTYAE